MKKSIILAIRIATAIFVLVIPSVAYGLMNSIQDSSPYFEAQYVIKAVFLLIATLIVSEAIIQFIKTEE